MIRKLNRIIKDKLRVIRLSLGKKIWDKKINSNGELFKNNKLDMSKVSSILIMRDDGKIGDMVVNTLMFREIKKVYPHIRIGVVTKGGAKDIIKYNPYVDTIYDYEKGNEEKIAKKIALENYDILIEFNEFLRVNQMKFINLCGAKINIGLDKNNWKMFDVNYTNDNTKHITDRYKKVLEILGVNSLDLGYDIYSDTKTKEKISKFVDELEIENLIILNPYGASKHRCFSKEKIFEITKKVLKNKNNKLAIIGEINKKQEIQNTIYEICEKLNIEKTKVFYPELLSILEVCEFISHAKYIITPDTSIVHIGVAKYIPTFAVYRPDYKDNNSVVWGPNSNRVKQIFSKDIPENGKQTDINLFDVEEIQI